MDQNESPKGEAEGVAIAKNATVDAIVAAVLLVIGIVVMFESRRLGADWTTDGPGSGYFPFYIALIICIGSVGILYQSLFSKSRDTDVFVDSVQLKRVASVLLPSCVYAAAIMFLGLYVASAIFISLFMIVLGKYPVARSVMLGVVINAVFFLMFEVWFKVPLYKGAWDPLGFLGY